MAHRAFFASNRRRKRSILSRLADVAGAIVDLARPLFAPRKPVDLDAMHVGATTEWPRREDTP